MSEPAPETTPSLIQQRNELGRARIAALIWMIGWGAVSAVRVAALDVGDAWDWVILAGSLALAIYGLTLWFGYRRRRRTFEAEHGADAGRQS